MGAEPIGRGARRRALLRAAVGKPGSVRRWLVGSLLFVSVCALLLPGAGFLGGIAIFLIASTAIVTAFRARSLAVGDEDEVNAWARREGRAGTRTPEPEEEKIRLSYEEWQRVQELMRVREYPLGGAPAAPSKESGDGARSTKRGSGAT